jgi:hypothetical protein
MRMRPIAAPSVASRRRRVVAGGTDIAAAVLKTTSCSVTRIGVGLRCAEPTVDEADPTSGVAVDLGSRCNILRMPPDGWWLLPESQLRYWFKAVALELPLAFGGGCDDHLDEHFRDKHRETPNTSSE